MFRLTPASTSMATDPFPELSDYPTLDQLGVPNPFNLSPSEAVMEWLKAFSAAITPSHKYDMIIRASLRNSFSRRSSKERISRTPNGCYDGTISVYKHKGLRKDGPLRYSTATTWQLLGEFSTYAWSLLIVSLPFRICSRVVFLVGKPCRTTPSIVRRRRRPR
jgi:hypothetical protein